MRDVHYRAAGGIVVHHGKVLLLDRPNRNEVRLPKGHIEVGESPSAAALREVREETGYEHPSIVADLGTQQVRFIDPYRDRKVLRDEHYFLMSLQDEVQTERDEQDLQFRPIWVRVSEAVDRLTFEAEQGFVARALRWMEENVV
jgi:8-oxo-dGTP diphosphatase